MASGLSKANASAAALWQLPEVPLQHINSGKVREIYAVDHAHLLLVATDRVSAFDVVMNEAVPHKGAVLTQITAWWLRLLERKKGTNHHMVSSDTAEIIDRIPQLRGFEEVLKGRAMLCRKTTPFPVEFVVRGFITGSAWKEYQKDGTLAGEKLPEGMLESEQFPNPIFSPATKAEAGKHDENITADRVARLLGGATAKSLEDEALKIYGFGRDVAASRGIIIADTKFEFGRAQNGTILLIDEVLTPDSSRFWPVDQYKPGQGQPSFDKQPLRNYLENERRAGRWNGEAPPPALPEEVVRATGLRYLAAFSHITGGELFHSI